MSSFPASAAVGTPSAPVVTGPPAGGTGSGDATGSDGFPSGQLLGALAFLLLLAFIGIGSVVRLRRGTKPPR